ncbi:hypothetical protein KEM54_004476, partial [Ascosphaera aggregata]
AYDAYTVEVQVPREEFIIPYIPTRPNWRSSDTTLNDIIFPEMYQAEVAAVNGVRPLHTGPARNATENTRTLFLSFPTAEMLRSRNVRFAGFFTFPKGAQSLLNARSVVPQIMLRWSIGPRQIVQLGLSRATLTVKGHTRATPACAVSGLTTKKMAIGSF